MAKTAARAAKLPKRPEELWGDESDPGSDHPKCVLQRALGARATSRVFEDLATESTPETLRKTCPESFKPFAAEMDLVARRLKKRSA